MRGLKTLIQRVNLLRSEEAFAKIDAAESHEERVALVDEAFIPHEEHGGPEILEHLGCKGVWPRGADKRNRGAPDFEAVFDGLRIGAESTEFVGDPVGLRNKTGKIERRSMLRVKSDLTSGNIEWLSRFLPNAKDVLRGKSYYVVSDAFDDCPIEESADVFARLFEILGSSTSEMKREIEPLFNSFNRWDIPTVGRLFHLGWIGAGYDKTLLRKRLISIPEPKRSDVVYPSIRRDFYVAAQEEIPSRRGDPEMAVCRSAMDGDDTVGVVNLIHTKGKIRPPSIIQHSEFLRICREKMGKMMKAERDGRRYEQKWLLLGDSGHESTSHGPSGRRFDDWEEAREKKDLPEEIAYWDRIVFHDSMRGESRTMPLESFFGGLSE